MFIFGIIITIIISIYMYKAYKEASVKETEIRESQEYKNLLEKHRNLISKYEDSVYYFKEEKYDEYGIRCKCKHYAILDDKICIFDEFTDEQLISRIASGKTNLYLLEHIYAVNEIKYYQLEGSIYQQQHISGGGGGGSSISGAVVGGLLAGDAGAIIGSRKKIDDIQTTYSEEDNRRVVVIFFDDEKLELPYMFYDKLLDYIPEKDYDNYITEKKKKGRK